MRTQPTPPPPSPLQHESGSLMAKLLPELSMLACVVWFQFAPAGAYRPDYVVLFFAVVADGATLMVSAALVDVASRLQRAPPWWVAPIPVLAIVLFFPDTLEVLQLGWSLGLWFFLPFAWSMLERLREIWTLPSATVLEKIRRRTLTFDRMFSALLIVGLWIVGGLVCMFLFDRGLDLIFSESNLPWPVLAFYAINAGNVLRVHRAAFARAPRSLWPRFDKGEGASLDPL